MKDKIYDSNGKVVSTIHYKSARKGDEAYVKILQWIPFHKGSVKRQNGRRFEVSDVKVRLDDCQCLLTFDVEMVDIGKDYRR